MAADWTQRPTVQQCGCGDWTIVAPMLSGRTVTLSLDVFTPVSFALWASSGRKPVYVVVNGGACLVRAGDGTRMGDWRREHACTAESVKQGKSQGLSRHPASPTPTTGVNGPQPPNPAASATATPATSPRSEQIGQTCTSGTLSAGQFGPATAHATAHAAAAPSAALPPSITINAAARASLADSSRVNVVTAPSMDGLVNPQKQAEELIVSTLGAIVVEREINDRIVYRLASAFQ